MNFSNWKLVLLGYKIVILIIFIVGFSTMFVLKDRENLILENDTLIENNLINPPSLNKKDIDLKIKNICDDNLKCYEFELNKYVNVEKNPDFCNLLVNNDKIEYCQKTFYDEIINLEEFPFGCNNLNNNFREDCNNYYLEKLNLTCENGNCYDNLIFDDFIKNISEFNCDLFQNLNYINNCEITKLNIERINNADFNYFCNDLNISNFRELCYKIVEENII